MLGFSIWLPIQEPSTPRAAEVAESGRPTHIYLDVAIMVSMAANISSVSKTWILIKVTISAEIQPLISYHITVKEY